MKSFPVAVASLAAVIAVGTWVDVRGQAPAAQVPGPAAPQLPGAPYSGKGEGVFPAVEGWGPHTDGTNTILIGYFNRNRDQTLDIPIGPNNHMDPGGPDLGQPTHFEPGRAYGVFALQVPKDFGNKKISWTLTSNGQTTTVQFSLNPPYWVDFFENHANGNTPPTWRLTKDGAALSGPPKGYAATLNATVNQPLPLSIWVSDKPNTYDPEEGLPADQRSARGRGRGAAGADANANAGGGGGGGRGARGGGAQQNFDVSAAGTSGQPRGRGGRGGGPPADITVAWKVHRGATAVKFSQDTERLLNNGDINAVLEAKTEATFSAPGEYVIRAQINDASGDGGGGDQCCWSNALFKVNVK